ncbi:phosphotransferase [Microbacterium kunmingense]|uniref:phosphotransferase n=1 Tax=Microbacterium kunmingense TaxID=2915939 RepID=UPI002003FB75|nr:phosphotransferase [Microbacterium kunmingense]
MHADEVTVDLATAKVLITEQFPRWAHLEVTPVGGTGTVNTIYRIGDTLTARFPRQRTDLATARRAVRLEAAALVEFEGVCPVAAPRPVAIGHPAAGYPMPWMVQTWVPGDVATPTSVADSAGIAFDLADLIQTLRRTPVKGRTFRGRGRGGNLGDHDTWVAHCLTQTDPLMDTGEMRQLWEYFRDLPPSRPHLMTHSDLTPFNLIVDRDRLAGVLDAGWFGPADPALDLVCGWHLFDHPARTVFRGALQSSPVEWARGAAWAFIQAIGLVWYYRTTNPAMAALGETTLHRLLTAPDIHQG